MPYREKETVKKYYDVGEATERLTFVTGFKIASSSLRFWEKGLNLKIKRKRGGSRQYTEEDLQLLRIIILLTYKYELGLAGVEHLLRSKEYRARLVSFLLTENFEFKALNHGK